MKKAVLFLFVFAGGFLFFKFFPFSTASDTDDLTGLNKKLTNQLNDSLFSHEKLYKEELMRMAIQLNQEPFLNMNQRYSRRILTTKQNPDIKMTEIVTNNLVNQQPPVEHRSTPKQLEYRATIGKIAIGNPGLPYEFIHDIL